MMWYVNARVVYAVTSLGVREPRVGVKSRFVAFLYVLNFRDRVKTWPALVLNICHVYCGAGSAALVSELPLGW